MKTILYAALCLVWGASHAEESRRVEDVRSVMESHGWETGDVSFQEIGRHDRQPIIIKRSGTVVGYHCEESVWERRDVKAEAFGGVTRIVFGYDHPRSPNLFEIDDANEIAVWIAAYRNHTEFERRFTCFIPTTKSAGFERRRDEYQFGGACMCSLALRFYVGDKEALELKGHIQDHSEIDSGMRNLVLHELAKARISKKPVAPAEDHEGQFIDPFAEESATESTNAEQDGAEQAPTAPESK